MPISAVSATPHRAATSQYDERSAEMNDTPAHPHRTTDGSNGGEHVTDNASATPDEVVTGLSQHIVGYTSALEKMTAMLSAGRELPVFLHAICTEVKATVRGADMVGITVLTDGDAHPQTAASTDARVNDVDAAQYRADEGPCLEAARSRHVVRAALSDAAARWPRFAASVADTGLASYLSAPLTLDGGHLGAINIYSYDTHGFDDVDEALVQLFVTAVEAAITISRRAASAEQELAGLTTAMRTRAIIEQAKGIIMAMQGVTAEHAFTILSAQSQSRNIKVADIAASLVDTVNTRTDTTTLPGS